MKKNSRNLVKLLGHLVSCLISGGLVVILLYYIFSNLSQTSAIASVCLLSFPVGPVFVACLISTKEFFSGVE